MSEPQLCVCVCAVLYLRCEQHVVDQLHVSLHLCSLYVVQAVTQRVALREEREKENPSFK